MASLYNLNLANASDAPIPGETAPADPYGALALIQGTGQTQSPPTAQVIADYAAAGSTVPVVAPSISNLSGTFTVGSLQVPYWAAGLALLGGLALLAGGRR
jgi:hypothetical protein